MTTVSRPDMENIAEDVGPINDETPPTTPFPKTDNRLRCPGCGKLKDPATLCDAPGCSTRGNQFKSAAGSGMQIKPPEGVGSPVGRGYPGSEPIDPSKLVLPSEPQEGIQPPVQIKPPGGVTLAPAGAPAAPEIEATIPVVVIRFKRGRCIFEDPIDTLVALEDAPSKLQNGTATELANLLREAVTSTAKIEFEDKTLAPGESSKVDIAKEQQANQLTYTETRAISDALVKWSEELGKS